MSTRVLILVLVLASLGATGCGASRDEQLAQLDGVRADMLGLYQQLRPTLAELGTVQHAFGQWHGCVDQGDHLSYSFFTVLVPPPELHEGFPARVHQRIAAQMPGAGAGAQPRWSVSAQHPDGRVSVEWVHPGCIAVDHDLYEARSGESEPLPKP